MKRTGLLLFFMGWAAGTGLWAAVPSSNSPTTYLFTLPQASLDFSDLDARDIKNRPLQTPEARQQLQTLFVASLASLLIQNLTPAKRLLSKLMAVTWDFKSGWLRRHVAHVWQDVMAWWGRFHPFKIIFIINHRGFWPPLLQHSPPLFSFFSFSSEQLASILSSTIIRR